jgi:hypothetical protein
LLLLALPLTLPQVSIAATQIDALGKRRSLQFSSNDRHEGKEYHGEKVGKTSDRQGGLAESIDEADITQAMSRQR